ncbi:hypothetical protein M1N20_02170, partial [Dehalococcoidia bacterium]|nr:hypothetical protein [Dehalococcoidia bacterium]
MKIGRKDKPKTGGAVRGLLLALCLILSLASPAFAVLPIPHTFSGTVTIGDQPAPVGTVVSAWVGEEEVASTTVFADGGYELSVSASPGDTIDFYVAGVWATSHPWEWGGETPLDLTIPGFDFSLAVDPTAATITQGEEVTATVTATLEAGITEEVTLTYTLPEGVEGITVTFDPEAGEPTFESTVTIAAATDATVGEHEITITGTGVGGLVRTTTFTLTVEALPFDFTLTVLPTAATITQGEETTAIVSVALLEGITEEVTLSYALPEGVAGITVTFDPIAGEPTFGSTTTIAAAADATVGEHAITITGTGVGGLVRTTTFTLTVEEAPPFDFSLAVDPTAATVTQGEEVTATVTATLVAGPAEEVTLTYSLPDGVAGITVTFDPEAGEPDFTSTMTIAAAAVATVGEHEITITGTSATAVETVTFTLTVDALPFDFSLAVEPTAATVTQGEEVTATVTATLEAGITEEVTLT